MLPFYNLETRVLIQPTNFVQLSGTVAQRLKRRLVYMPKLHISKDVRLPFGLALRR